LVSSNSSYKQYKHKEKQIRAKPETIPGTKPKTIHRTKPETIHRTKPKTIHRTE
jgi:hypothetical protein